MAQRFQGRNLVVLAVEGEAPAASDGSWVDITAENRTGFDDSTIKPERPRNAGAGRMAHDVIDHAEGDVTLTIDSTSVSRRVFAAGGGRRVSFLVYPRGRSGSYIIYQTFVSVVKNYEASGAVTYNVTGNIEIAPTEGP